MIKTFLNPFVVFLLMGSLLFSCEKDDMDIEVGEEDKEFRYVRLLVSDELNTDLSYLNPFNETIESFHAQYPGSSLYATESKRYAALIHRSNNLLETFDTGLEFHGDHVDVRGTPKFGALIGNSAQPTHFKSSRGELITFNDGDGTLSFGKEGDIHTVGAEMENLDLGLEKHHGAMASFSDGSYAVTEKDYTIEGSLPEKVKIVDGDGNTVHEAVISTQGIHGNASDGVYAVFGSVDGILVVESDGNQKIIDYPSDFGTVWIGSIYETNVSNKFIGFTAAKGAYLIDVAENSITAILEDTEIMKCVPSFDGNRLGLLLYSGVLKVYDLHTNSVDEEIQAISLVDKDEEGKPNMKLTSKYAYVIFPNSGELWQIPITDDGIKKVYTLGGRPYQLEILGYETNESH